MKKHTELPVPSILIVDDMLENLSILKAVLKNHYSVQCATNGDAALSIARAIPQPDLILLDIMMPGIDGFEVMRRLQAEPFTRDIPVIFITALADMENEINGLKAGAVDYINKPINLLVVLGRVATHLALRQAKKALESRTEELLRERTLVENIIIRMRSHKHFDDRNLHYLIAPAERTNGDILLSAFTPQGRQWVLLGDFTGHGLQAAIAAPLVAHLFYSAAAAGESIEATVAAINNILYLQLPTEIFMAGCVVDISRQRDEIQLWNAAMPECILLGGDNRVRKIIAPTGLPPFGIMPDIDVSGGHTQCMVTVGEKIYLFSDGVTEAMNSSDEVFGLNRVIEYLLSARSIDLPLSGFIPMLETFHGSSVFNDDITFVEILF
jgi:CheY-like chemotaxis protein